MFLVTRAVSGEDCISWKEWVLTQILIGYSYKLFLNDWIGVHISLLVTYRALFCTKGVRAQGEGSTQAPAQLSFIQWIVYVLSSALEPCYQFVETNIRECSGNSPGIPLKCNQILQLKLHLMMRDGSVFTIVWQFQLDHFHICLSFRKLLLC